MNMAWMCGLSEVARRWFLCQTWYEAIRTWLSESILKHLSVDSYIGKCHIISAYVLRHKTKVLCDSNCLCNMWTFWWPNLVERCRNDVQFTHQQMHIFILKKHIKIYIKIRINIAPTCFGLRPSSGSLHCTCLKLYLR